MNRFTKGPWNVQDPQEGLPIIEKDFDDIAYIRAPTLASGSEILANAHLISAAPDMYEALSGAIRVVDLWYAEYVDEEHAGETEALATMKNMFEQALAKAEGK
jgi:hypothetical protein